GSRKLGALPLFYRQTEKIGSGNHPQFRKILEKLTRESADRKPAGRLLVGDRRRRRRDPDRQRSGRKSRVGQPAGIATDSEPSASRVPSHRRAVRWGRSACRQVRFAGFSVVQRALFILDSRKKGSCVSR